MDPLHNESEEHISIDLYDTDEGETPAVLLWVALVHCYCVAIFGAIGKRLIIRLDKVVQHFWL